MGTCYNCKSEITLQDGQTKCDKCGNVIYYVCHNCKKGFETSNEEGIKRQECSICGYFYCPYCNSCGSNCQKKDWIINLKKIWNEIWTSERLSKTIEYFEKIKTSNERKECIKHIPITYAKGRIKSLLAKIEGFRIKNEYDKNAFIRRIDEVTNLPIGTKLTVSKSRQDGTYGQEYRDAFNLLVCLGKLKLSWEKKIDSEDKYALYERVEENRCPMLNATDLIINECPKCNKIYKKEVKFCSCQYKKDTKKHKKDDFYETKKRLNNIDTCQMYRGDFNGKT